MINWEGENKKTFSLSAKRSNCIDKGGNYYES